jgi:multidrug efflux pump subunit AcrB
MGYSINTLTLFGMVLSIGIVVDDAIVVLENVRAHHARGTPAGRAKRRFKSDVGGDRAGVIAIVLTCVPSSSPLHSSAAFRRAVPAVFGNHLDRGRHLRLRRTHAERLRCAYSSSNAVIVHRCAFFRWFNVWFGRATGRYADGVAWMLRRGTIGILLLAAMVAFTIGLWRVTPTSLVPDEDAGYYIGAVFLPDGATLERTDQVVQKVTQAIVVQSCEPVFRSVHGPGLPRRRVPQQCGDNFCVTKNTWGRPAGRCIRNNWSASST